MLWFIYAYINCKLTRKAFTENWDWKSLFLRMSFTIGCNNNELQTNNETDNTNTWPLFLYWPLFENLHYAMENACFWLADRCLMCLFKSTWGQMFNWCRTSLKKRFSITIEASAQVKCERSAAQLFGHNFTFILEFQVRLFPNIQVLLLKIESYCKC